MQIFSRSLNKLPILAGAATLLLGGLLTAVVWYYFTPKNFQVGYAPSQPVPYSHRLHAGQMGMDCRYCHANVEHAAFAMVPPTQTCMGCHSLVKTDSKRLEPVRTSWESGKPIEWVKIHQLPDHVHFNHSAHVNIGGPNNAAVGCATCHGRVDNMDVMKSDQSISMGWCLDCHRDPKPNLRPKSELTNMEWKPEMIKNWTPPEVNPPQHCSGCHR